MTRWQRTAALLATSAGLAASPTAIQLDGQVSPGGVVGPQRVADVIEDDTAPYVALTNPRSSFVELNPEPFTGLAVGPQGGVWATNAQASTVVRYPDAGSPANLLFSTGLHPVSIAIWQPQDEPSAQRVLVACTGTHALFLHDATDGTVLDVLPLDSEPADLVVDTDHEWAFVSCQGTNTVLQIDLPTLTVEQRYEIGVGERAGYLYWDRGAPGDLNDNRVYVAPAITGNNTTIDRLPDSSVGFVRDLAGFAGGELPDIDLHRIDPFGAPDTPATSANAIQPVATGVGSLLFDLDRNPISGDLWVLSSHSDNGNPAKQTEPDLNGDFAVNQLVILPGVTASSPLQGAPPGIDLDDHDPGAVGPQYDSNRSVNQARALAFDPNGGAFIVSPFSDVIAWTDATGARVQDFRLPTRAQCFDVELYDGGRFLALCRGSMSVEVFSYDPFIATPVASLPLGFDPTPATVRRGRDVFYAGQHSSDGRLSCASCHPRGGSDQLAWSLTNLPGDVKDVMLTQSLLSIADTYPHHWRGERDLSDFSKAFGGLLGAAPADLPTHADIADLVVFLQSLQAPANPVQSPLRIVDDARTPGPIDGLDGSAVRGQELFQTVEVAEFRAFSGCHTLQNGSNGNMFIEGDMFEIVTDLAPRAVNIETPHLRQFQNRGRGALWIDKNLDGDSGLPGSQEERDEFTNINGYGFSHTGTFAALKDFIADFELLDAQAAVDITKFVEQWDQGISPAAHWARFYDGDSPPELVQRIEDVLIDGVQQGWNDVAAFGLYDDGGGQLEPTRWLYVRASQHFVADDPLVAPLTWEEMQTATTEGRARHAFVGLPPGTGQVFAIDFDKDGLSNGAEAALGTDPWDPDSDDDGWVDGHEEAPENQGDALDPEIGTTDTTPPTISTAAVDFVTARMAKYQVRFSEDVRYEVEYGIPGEPSRILRRDDFTDVDTFVLTHDDPASFGVPGFETFITITDRGGNVVGPQAIEPFVPLDTAFSLLFPIFVHVEEIEVMEAAPLGPGAMRIRLRIQIRTNIGAPEYLASIPQMVFSAVSVSNPATGQFEKLDDFQTPLPRTFDVYDFINDEVFPYNSPPGGDFIVSPLTDETTGDTEIMFIQPNLVSGQEVRVSVMGSVLPQEGLPGVYRLESFGQLQPLKLEDSMEVTIQFP